MKSKLSAYQKRIGRIDTVILCVAEAERMIESIGSDPTGEMDQGNNSQGPETALSPSDGFLENDRPSFLPRERLPIVDDAD